MTTVGSLQFVDADYICVATDLLSKMMSERESLEVVNRRITLAMAAAGHDLRQRLHILLGTVDLLTSTKDEVRSAELNQRAKSLIFRLAGGLEQLALQAERESSCGSAWIRPTTWWKATSTRRTERRHGLGIVHRSKERGSVGARL